MIKNGLVLSIHKLYQNDDQFAVVIKTVKSFQLTLEHGYSSFESVDRMKEYGVMPEDLGLSMAVALSRTDDSFLNTKDRSVKKIVMESYKDMIKEFEEIVN